MILGMSKILDDISKFVNKCLGPLGSEGFQVSDVQAFIIQLVATLILFLVVRFFLWKPITKIIEAKRKAIDNELETAKQENDKAKKLTYDLQVKMDEATLQVRTIIEKAQKEAKVQKEQIIEEAKQEAKKRIDNAQVEIDQEIKNKNNEIRQMIVDVAFIAASKIVSSEVDQDKYIDIVNEIIEGAKK